ncbi:hypothetical protein [Bacillus sp. 165]|uniref:DUF6414 family protein n=1 Tax=Bacillus sp. 165 TaxID=1529117 RepID=UPI001AD9C920|nr:hypothetical protein [Bacillus sp. 165]MBO9129788.1 hypothetical protein [Bacillus sp. 165]
MLERLRDFYYIDQRSLLNYLSVIEEGVLQTIQQSVTGVSPKHHLEFSAGDFQKLLCKLGLPVPALAYKRESANTTVTFQASKEPTVESQFMKLCKYLEPVMNTLTEVTQEEWNSLTIGEFITCTCKIELPAAYTMSVMLNEAADFLTFAKELHLPVQDKTILEHGVKYGKKILEKQMHHVMLHPVRSPEPFLFTAPLHQSFFLGAALSDLQNGSYTITARIEHLIGAEERYPIFDSMAPFFYPDKIAEQDCFVTAPAVVIKVLAIYR